MNDMGLINLYVILHITPFHQNGYYVQFKTNKSKVCCHLFVIIKSYFVTL